MNIPNFLKSIPIAELKEEDGKYYFTPQMANMFIQLFTELQQNLSNEGFKIPQQTTSNINILDNALSTAAIIYDSDTNEFKGNVDGVFKTFTLT